MYNSIVGHLFTVLCVWYREILSDHWEGVGRVIGGGNGKQSRMGLAEKPNVSRAHAIMGQKNWNKRAIGLPYWWDLALSLAFPSRRTPGWSGCSCLHFPTDGTSDGKELSMQPRMGWPGRGCQGYSSLGVLDRMSSDTETCHSSKIV